MEAFRHSLAAKAMTTKPNWQPLGVAYFSTTPEAESNQMPHMKYQKQQLPEVETPAAEATA
jgi:hypothetical protein